MLVRENLLMSYLLLVRCSFQHKVFYSEPESSLFQLRAGPFSSCAEWTVSNMYNYYD